LVPIVVRCSKCAEDAITYIRYNGTALCSKHLREFVERRAKKEVRRQLRLDGPKRLGVAVSGGKDSAVALELLSNILGRRRDVEIVAITVDEGISGYRSLTLGAIRSQTARLGIDHRVVRFQDVIGMELDDLGSRKGERTPCSFCGVFRRRCLNLESKRLGVDVLATGHNLDDTAQSILMNFMRGDVERLARLGPHLKVQPGLVPRIEPLRLIPEKETYLYALLKGIEFSDAECPYAADALRNEYREMVDSTESRHPGTRHSIVASYDAIRPSLMSSFPQTELGRCACGEPTCGERCMACELLEEIRKND
jgi:uncharacterized protein (TIGR00269 family)